MSTYYTLHNAAGLIRTNKFLEKADAICVGTFRAEFLQWPIKILEHTEPGDGKCILVCNPDGSVEEPQGAGYKTADLGNAASGLKNSSEAYILLSSFDDSPITTFYLKTDLTESTVGEIEKTLGVDLGLYDPRTLHAYTEEPSHIKALEEKLAEASVEIDRVVDPTFKKVAQQTQAALVEAARKGHVEARKERLPELSVRASMKYGGKLRFQGHCEMVPAKDNKPPKIKVFIDGSPAGEVKSDREAAKIIADHAEKEFKKFLKKEL